VLTIERRLCVMSAISPSDSRPTRRRSSVRPRRSSQPRVSSVVATPVSVALKMAACRVSIPSKIHTTQSTTKPVQVRS
jgi:hypothetical protein